MIKILALVIPFLVLEINNAAHHQEKRFRPPPFYQKNASAVYDPTTELCCKGKVQPKTRLEKCCGEGIYKPSREFCCDGTVIDLKIGFDCCGNTTYDAEKQICCNGQASDLDDPNNPNLECCVTEVYDMSKQKCCRFTTNASAVVDTPKPDIMSCCGLELYDPETHICCQDEESEMSTIYSKSETAIAMPVCCGIKLGDANTHGCCGNDTYNMNNQACCYTPDNTIVANISSPGESCCGLSGEIYDPEAELCCFDEVFNKTDSNLECCGNKTINSKEEICCWSINGSYPIKKEEPVHNECCGNKSYNMQNEMCCSKDNENVIHPQGEGISYGCCGLKKFDYTQQMCCNDEIFEQTANSSIGCCREKTYDINKQTCCWNYDQDTQTSNSTIINEVKPNAICCGDELYTASSNKECCNNKVYDRVTEVCCGSKIVSKEGKESRDLCCHENPELLNQIYPYY